MTSDVGTTTGTKHGRPGPYGPPHNSDRPTTGEPTPANKHHAPGMPRSQHIHRTGQAGCRNPRNKPGRQRKQRPTTLAQATQPLTDQTAAEQQPDNEQTTRKPANTQPARHARAETGTVSHGLATTCCAKPIGDHTHERTTTPRFYHSTTDQRTKTTYFEPPTPRPQRLTITGYAHANLRTKEPNAHTSTTRRPRMRQRRQQQKNQTMNKLNIPRLTHRCTNQKAAATTARL